MLSWRIPTTGDPSLLRLGLAQVALASIVAALILFVAIPRDWLVPALLGLFPLAVFMAYRRWYSYHQSFVGPDNVRLDDQGLFWTDGAGDEQGFRRDSVTAFCIGRDAETLRPVPALTLHLSGGFESQPIELHPPATSAVVRQFLAEGWHLTEKPLGSESSPVNYDSALGIYSECHDDFQEWHFEGTRDELLRLCETFQSVARELPLPPLGAKPLCRTVLCIRRERQRLKIAHDRNVHLDDNVIAAPAEFLESIALHAAAGLRENEGTADFKFDVLITRNDIWTFHIHLRSA